MSGEGRLSQPGARVAPLQRRAATLAAGQLSRVHLWNCDLCGYTLAMVLQFEQISVLRQVTCLITCQAGESIDQQIAAALQTLAAELGAEAAAIYWQAGERLTRRYQWPAEYVPDPYTDRRLSRSVRLGQVIRPVGNAFWLAVPMRVGGQTLGRLWVLCKPGRSLSAAEQELLLLAGNQLALALENARMCQEISHLAERRGALLRRLVDLREERGRSLARELHDEISQSLVALLIDLDTANAADPHAAAALRPYLERIRTGVLRVSDEINRIVLDLRPSLLEDQGLEAALRRYAGERLQSSDTAIHLQLACQPGRLASGLETAIYRIGQEALSNIARHAAAANVWVDLACDDGECTLTVRDDGAGFDVRSTLEHPRSLQAVGLIGMQERAEQAGGRVVIESSSGAGTLITATIPVAGGCHDE